MDNGRLAGLTRIIDLLGQQVSLAGKTVLEVGADWEEVSAGMILARGATRVVSTNFAPGWPTKTSPDGRIVRRTLDALRMAESLPAGSVDVLFGVAVMEHFMDVPRFFASAREVMRPGGVMFVQGGPLWTSAVGHHVWVDGRQRNYHFNDASNPLQNWSHLFLSRAEMKASLLERGIDAVDAEAIVTYVYDSEEVNRVGYKSMRRFMAESGFKNQKVIEGPIPPPDAATMARIAKGPYAGEGRFDVTDLILVGTA